MKNQPDFIVEPSGKVHDVRYLKHPENQHASSTGLDSKNHYEVKLDEIQTEMERKKRYEEFRDFPYGLAVFMMIVIIIIIKLFF